MKREDLLLLIPIAFVIGVSYVAISVLYELNTDIVNDLHTPFNIDVLPDHMNKDLTCHKVGLYTNWDEGWMGSFDAFVTGIDVAGHARQLFFAYDCSLVCYKYWESDKICIAELYPHEG